MKFTFIMPVYNGSKFLKKSIPSILNQTYKNFEFIVVNDGSTDNSLQIINDLCKNQKNVKIIDKKNTGVSDTRNIAISKAKGDWIIFVDADDYIDLNALDVISKEIEDKKFDFLISNLYFNDSKIMYENMKNIKNGDQKQILESMISYYYGQHNYKLKYGNARIICGKVFKREIIEKYKIKFPTSIQTFEDGIFNILYCTHSKNIFVREKPFYHYNTLNQNSATHSHRKNQFEQDITTIQMLEDTINNINLSETALNYTMLEMYCTLINDVVFYYNCKLGCKMLKKYYNYFEKRLNKIDNKLVSKKDLILLFLSKHHFYLIIYILYYSKLKIKK